MIVSIHQPSYFPWLGWLHKVVSSDVFVLMDDVQLSDSAYQHRNIFLTNTGNEKFLSVGIKKKGYKDVALKDIELRPDFDWQDEHLRFFNANYIKHPFYNDIMHRVSGIYQDKYATLGDVLFDVTKITMELFGIKTKMVRLSELGYDMNAKKGDLVLEIIKLVDADTYLSGTGAREYMDDKEFADNGINLVYQQFKHPFYSQYNTGCEQERFIPGIASLDVLFNVGADGVKELLHKQEIEIAR